MAIQIGMLPIVRMQRLKKKLSIGALEKRKKKKDNQYNPNKAMAIAIGLMMDFIILVILSITLQ